MNMNKLLEVTKFEDAKGQQREQKKMFDGYRETARMSRATVCGQCRANLERAHINHARTLTRSVLRIPSKYLLAFLY